MPLKQRGRNKILQAESQIIFFYLYKLYNFAQNHILLVRK